MSINFNSSIGSTSGLSGSDATSRKGDVGTSHVASNDATSAANHTEMEGLSSDLTHVPKDAVISHDHPSDTSTVAERMDTEAKLDSDGDGLTDNIDNDDYNDNIDNNPNENK